MVESLWKKVRGQRRYRHCGEIGHNARTCAVGTIDVSGSGKSGQYSCVLQIAVNCDRAAGGAR
jgi:hypothetical protein